MLKIKDNIPFEELRKYGFDNYYDGEMYITEIVNGTKIYSDDLVVFMKDREIKVGSNEVSWCKYTDVLYDLIKDGLVEKVSDKYV